MKTNQFRNNRINILFYLAAILFLPFIVNAQFRVSTGGGATVGDTTSNSTGLKVYGGDININGTTNSFQINGKKVLWNNNDTTKILVGVGAGSVTTGANNTALGYHALNANTTGTSNVATGYQALNGNISGVGSNAYGYKALYANTASSNNAFGYAALTANTSGANNTAMGHGSLTSNVSGSSCSAFGYQALLSSTNSYNTGIGYAALKTNTTGSQNTALGTSALYSITTGSYNCGAGYNTGFNITTGSSNTTIGTNAGYNLVTGDSNTFVGANTDVSGVNNTAFHNCGGFGYGATATASDMIRIGNSKIITIQGQIGFTTSDGRFKTNIHENVKGVDFIKRLRPVTYQLKTNALDNFCRSNIAAPSDSSGQAPAQSDNSLLSGIQSGLIAQEVEQAASDAGFSTNIIHHPANANDPYAISYEGLVVPLIKAVQEQQKMIDSLQVQINQLKGVGNKNSQSGNNSGGTVGSINVQLSNADVVVLNEAVPNPFAEQTVIAFNIPSNFNTAQMLFYDSNGKLIKSVDIKTAGKGQLNVFANDLSNGTYSYTLVVDGKIVATKRMIRQQ